MSLFFLDIKSATNNILLETGKCYLFYDICSKIEEE